MNHPRLSFLPAALLLAAAQAVAADAAPGEATIYFVRHADTAKSGNSYIDKFTPEGDRQVAALPGKLEALAPKFDVILVSPAWRAINTILPYLKQTGQKAAVLPELNESSYRGSDSSPDPRPDGQVHLSSEEQKYLRVADGYGALLGPGLVPKAPGSAAGGKLVSFANDLVRKNFAGKHVNVLLVGHYHTGSRLLKALQGGGVPEYGEKQAVYQPGNGAVTVLQQDCNSDNFVLVQYNDGREFNGQPLPQGSPDFKGGTSSGCGVAKAR